MLFWKVGGRPEVVGVGMLSQKTLGARQAQLLPPVTQTYAALSS